MKKITRAIAAIAIVGAISFPAPSQANIFNWAAYYWFGFSPSIVANLFSDGSPWVATISDSSCDAMGCVIQR